MDFSALFAEDDGGLDQVFSQWLLAVRKSFEKFVPKRLHEQINQRISCYAGEIIGLVIEELIHRGVLEKPEMDLSQPEALENTVQKVGKPLVNGIFYVEGEMLDV